jgi:hypothetical protein
VLFCVVLCCAVLCFVGVACFVFYNQYQDRWIGLGKAFLASQVCRQYVCRVLASVRSCSCAVSGFFGLGKSLVCYLTQVLNGEREMVRGHPRGISLDPLLIVILGVCWARIQWGYGERRQKSMRGRARLGLGRESGRSGLST